MIDLLHFQISLTKTNPKRVQPKMGAENTFCLKLENVQVPVLFANFVENVFMYKHLP